jgi:acetyltransferase-like isoleucine patch superfamily enzyme
VIILLDLGTTKLLLGKLPIGDFRGILFVSSVSIMIFFYALIIYRIFIFILPFGEGDILEDSKEEFAYHVYILFFLIYFYPLMRSGFIPMPLLRLIYIALGTRLGKNTYCAGIMLDPPFIEIGANSAVGQYALLIPHVIEGKRLAHYRIKIGNNVTIGAHAVVMSGVTIGDNAIVGVGAVVPKGTHIGTGEIWGGVPAKKIKDIETAI